MIATADRISFPYLTTRRLCFCIASRALSDGIHQASLSSRTCSGRTLRVGIRPGAEVLRRPGISLRSGVLNVGRTPLRFFINCD